MGYQIKAGESYFSAAERIYGDQRMAFKLMAANGNRPLHPGDVITTVAPEEPGFFVSDASVQAAQNLNASVGYQGDLATRTQSTTSSIGATSRGLVNLSGQGNLRSSPAFSSPNYEGIEKGRAQAYQQTPIAQAFQNFQPATVPQAPAQTASTYGMRTPANYPTSASPQNYGGRTPSIYNEIEFGRANQYSDKGGHSAIASNLARAALPQRPSGIRQALITQGQTVSAGNVRTPAIYPTRSSPKTDDRVMRQYGRPREGQTSYQEWLGMDWAEEAVGFGQALEMYAEKAAAGEIDSSVLPDYVSAEAAERLRLSAWKSGRSIEQFFLELGYEQDASGGWRKKASTLLGEAEQTVAPTPGYGYTSYRRYSYGFGGGGGGGGYYGSYGRSGSSRAGLINWRIG